MLPPVFKDLELLRRHHTKPVYKIPSVDSMAKWGNYGYSDAAGSEYYAWPVAQHPWNQKGGGNWKGKGKSKAAADPGSGQNQQKGGQKTPSFPKYDYKSAPQIIPVKSRQSEREAQEPGVVQSYQRLVTQARKCETKVRKLCQELTEKRAQWKCYQEEMKCTYRAERKRFLSDTMRIEASLREAKIEEETAKAQLQTPHQDSLEDLMMLDTKIRPECDKGRQCCGVQLDDHASDAVGRADWKGFERKAGDGKYAGDPGQSHYRWRGAQAEDAGCIFGWRRAIRWRPALFPDAIAIACTGRPIPADFSFAVLDRPHTEDQEGPGTCFSWDCWFRWIKWQTCSKRCCEASSAEASGCLWDVSGREVGGTSSAGDCSCHARAATSEGIARDKGVSPDTRTTRHRCYAGCNSRWAPAVPPLRRRGLECGGERFLSGGFHCQECSGCIRVAGNDGCGQSGNDISCCAWFGFAIAHSHCQVLLSFGAISFLQVNFGNSCGVKTFCRSIWRQQEISNDACYSSNGDDPLDLQSLDACLALRMTFCRVFLQDECCRLVVSIRKQRSLLEKSFVPSGSSDVRCGKGGVFMGQRGGRLSLGIGGHVPAESMRCSAEDTSMVVVQCLCGYVLGLLPRGTAGFFLCRRSSNFFGQRGGRRSCGAGGHVPTASNRHRAACEKCVLNICSFRISFDYMSRGKTCPLQCSLGSWHGVPTAHLQIAAFIHFTCDRASWWPVLQHICDALPWRPAEVSYYVVLLLQRQNLLPDAYSFANPQSNALCPAIDGTPGDPRSMLLLLSEEEQTNGHGGTHGWLYWRLRKLQYKLDSFLTCLLCWLWACVQSFGEWWQQVFMLLSMIAGRHLGQLLLFALQLKGGQYNADNILRGSRALCSGCPLDAAVGLSKFSPRLSSMKSPRKLGFSADLWLFLILLSAMCSGVNAGAGSRHHVDSAGFRASRRSRKLSSAVYNLRTACRHLDSPDTPADNPDGQPPEDPSSDSEGDWDFATESFLFQFFAFGCLPANMVCAFLVGISLQEAIDQVSVDAIVPVHDESGVFIPAKGVPLRDSVTLIWRPDWLVASYNHVLFVDASMLGRYPFVIQFHGFTISYAALAAQLQPIWAEELDYIYVFVPFFSQEPMQEQTRFPASDGLTVVLQRDAIVPARIPNPAEAFKQYRLWGMDVEQVDQPPADLRWPVEKVQMSLDSETGLFSIGSQDPTLPVFLELANRFVHGVDERQIVIASLVPDRHVWFGEPVSQLVAVSTAPIQQEEVCVFLVLRGIGRESRSAWLSRRDLTPTQILSALDLDIAFIPGFKISVTGGTRQHGQLQCRQGDVLFFSFVLDDADQETSESEAHTSDSDEDESGPFQHGLREPYEPDEDHGNDGDGVPSATGPADGETHGRDAGGGPVYDKWNCVFQDDSAFVESRRRDTSVGQDSAVGGFLQTRLVPRHIKRRRTPIESAWSLFGTILLAHVGQNEGVLLPLEVGGNDLSSPDGRVTYAFATEHECKTGSDAFSCQSLGFGSGLENGQPGGHDSFFDDCNTLLDCAKDATFRSTCQELSYFIEMRWQTTENDKVVPGPKTTLCLDHLISTGQRSDAPACEASAKLCLDASMLDDFFGLFCICNACSNWPEIDGIPAGTRDMLESMAFWDRSAPYDAIRAYTDGSFFERSQRSGWAVLIMVSLAEEWHVAGFFAGCIQGTAFESGVQAIGLLAFSSEVVALMVALAHVGNGGVVNAEIIYDATSAADIVLGEAWPQNAESPVLAAKMLGRYVRQRIAGLQWRHVKSHTGCPFNDFVDAAAKHAARTGKAYGGDVSALGEAMTDPYFMWMWWHRFACSHPSVLPAFDEHGATVPLQFQSRQADPQWASGKLPGVPDDLRTCVRTTEGWFELAVVTYDTLSLYSAAQRVMLSQQFAAAGLHVIGLQEIRKNCEPVETVGAFRVFSSEHPVGIEGCQIWLNLSVHTGANTAGEKCFWHPDARIWRSSSRLLIVFAQTGGQQFALVSAHAPPSTASAAVLRAWWDDFVCSIKQIPRRLKIILLIDANARFSPSDELGSVSEAFPENLSAELFQGMLSDLGLKANDLYSHTGETVVTWISPCGRPACLDYIAASGDISVGLHTVGQLANFQDCFDFDHRPLLVRLAWQKDVQTQHRLPRLDRAAMVTEQGKQKLAEIFATAPLAPWFCSADVYLEALNDHLFQQLAALTFVSPDKLLAFASSILHSRNLLWWIRLKECGESSRKPESAVRLPFAV